MDIDEDSSDDDDDDDGSLEIEDSDTGDMRLEFSQGRRYHLATAVEKFCNEGRSSMAAQTSVRRIRIVDSSRLSLVGECKTPSDSCKVMKVGNQGHFTERGWGKSKRTLKMRGTILFMATAFSDTRSPDRSSTNFMPLNEACVCHKNVVMFIRGKDGKIYRAHE